MAAADRLNELLTRPDTGLDRLLSAVAAAVHGERADTETLVVSELDRLAKDCPDPVDHGNLFNYVYGTLGFNGNLSDYYDPENSLIDRVLARRRGIPLSLAAIVSELARRRGRDLRPVGMPGHVLVGEGPSPTRWYDPFNRGIALGVEDCRSLFGRLHPIEAFEPGMLQPMTGLEVCIRTLNNLRIAYARRGDAGRIVNVLELRADMTTAGSRDRLELAELLVGLGRFDQAAEQYELLSFEDPDNSDTYRARYRDCLVHRN